MANRHAYPRNQSRLYKIGSRRRLASILELRKDDLRLLTASDDNYIRWNDKKTGRSIQKPKPLLEGVHDRVGRFLSRIETPEFLHSAVKGHSYITNADSHASDQPTVKTDIRRFYTSARAQAVFHFFRDRMLCADDVAGIMTHLLTVDGHLATGSSASPILSYFAYEDMFDEVMVLADRRNCVMTCYVDDVVITGPGATRRLLYDVRRIFSRYHLHGHKTQIFKAGQPKVITGVAVTRKGRKLPNRRQRKIAQELKTLKSTTNDVDTLSVSRPLMGRLYEASQIDESWLPKAQRMSKRVRDLDRKISEKTG